MKILFYYYYGGGGGLSNLLKLVEVYARTFPEHTLTIVCHPDSGLTQLTGKNIHVIKYGSKINKEIGRLKLGLFSLHKIARKINADIIWSINLGTYTAPPVPQVITLNNAFQVYPERFLKYHSGSRVKIKLLRFFFRLSCRHSKAIILQTTLMANYVSKLNGKIQTYVIPKAVEEEIISPDENSAIPIINSLKTKGQKICLYIATLHPHKNHEILIKAFKYLAENNINHISLVVSLSRENLEEIDKEAAAKLINENLIIPVNWIAFNELKRFYDLSDVCVVPSKLESLSSAYIEAMKWKVPLLVSDLPFARDICGEAAVYADPDNYKEWGESINKILKDKSLRDKLINFGQKRITTFPETWEEVARRINEVLLKNLNTK